MAFTFRSGRWQERPLVSESSHIFVLRTYDVHSSTIIEEIETMQKSGDASLAMYYYDFREDKKKDLCGLLSSVLFQLCKQSDSYHPVLSTFYLTHLNGARTPSDDALIRCLIDLLKLPGSRLVYLIIDALDECPSTSSLPSPREELLSLLEDLVEEQLPNLRICVTSRPEVDIKTILEPLAFRSISLEDAPGQQKDIRDYIESIVGTNKKMQDWSSHHKQRVTDVLTRKADGM
jgi:NACHT domain